MTAGIFSNLKHSWGEELEKTKREFLLLFDSCTAHPRIGNLYWIELIFLLPNVTATLQPMSQCMKMLFNEGVLFK